MPKDLLVFVQALDWVWVELNGEKIWEESSWGSIDQFFLHYLPERPVMIKYESRDED